MQYESKLKDSLGYRKIPVLVGEMRNSRHHPAEGTYREVFHSGISFSDTDIVDPSPNMNISS